MIGRTILCISTLLLAPLATGQSGDLPLPDLEPITPENAIRIVHLADLGKAYGKVVFSPDGTLLASVKEYGGHEIYVWDLRTGELTTLVGPQQFLDIWDLEFSPDGAILASGSAYGDIILWSVATGELIKSLESESGHVWDLTFNADGTLLAASRSVDAEIWTLETGERKVLTGNLGALRNIVFSPDETMVAVGGGDGARLWDVATGKPLIVMEIGTGGGGVAFHPDGTSLVFGGERVRLFDVETGEQLIALEPDVPGFSVAFDPDGTLLVSGNTVWDTETWDILTTLEKEDGSPIFADYSPQPVEFSPDGTLLRTGNVIWDTVTWRQLFILEEAEVAGFEFGHVKVSLSPDRTLLAFVGDTIQLQGTVQLWGVPAGE
ncbi:MAG: WD40 repeat domain-containing protein [Anaerolineae bacterium]|nr:WD40 repeat domain-containing protein [Anaerolineae bacterium]